MGFEAEYTAIFDDIESTLKALYPVVKQVIYKKESRGIIRELPCVFINPGRWSMEPTDSLNAGSTDNFALDLKGELVVLIREGDSEKLFEEIMKPLGAIVDAIFADPTLGGTCLVAWSHEGSPGEVNFLNKLYSGGLIGIRAIKEYS